MGLTDSKSKVYVVVAFEPLKLGLEAAIPQGRDLSVCGTASSLQEAVQSRAFADADVILIDTDALIQSDVPSVLPSLGDGVIGLKVLFLGEMQDIIHMPFETLQVLLKLDTIGFILKAGPAYRLVEALKLVATRGFVCESDAIKHVLSRLSLWATQANQPSSNNGAFGHLSDREMEVLDGVVRGKSNKEIARDLFVSEGTVKAHVSHIMSKMNVERRTELVKQALMSGLVVPLDED